MENGKNACTFGDTPAASGVYCTSRTDLNMKINSCVQATSIDFCLQSMELVVQCVIELLRLGMIHFRTDTKSPKFFQGVRVSTHSPSENANALFKGNIHSIPKTFEALKRVSATTKNTSQRTNNFCNKI